MMKHNEELPDIEKLARHEFDLDIEEQTRLQAEGEAEIEQVGHAIPMVFVVTVYHITGGSCHTRDVCCQFIT